MTIRISSAVNTQYFVSTFRMVCLARNVLVKSIRSAITLLLPSAQKEVNSKLLLVFFDRCFSDSLISLMWLLLVVLE